MALSYFCRIIFSFILIIFSLQVVHAGKKKKCIYKGKLAPDLIVVSEGTNIKWSGKCNAVSPKLVGSVTIKNVGSAATPIVNSSVVSVWDSGNESCKNEDALSKVLEPGEQLKTEIKACRFIAGQKLNGKRKIKIKIDKYNKINECNERNNSWPGSIEIELACS